MTDAQTANEYVVARDCGHRVYWTSYPSLAGMEWCDTCRRLVGLIVTRIEARRV